MNVNRPKIRFPLWNHLICIRAGIMLCTGVFFGVCGENLSKTILATHWHKLQIFIWQTVFFRRKHKFEILIGQFFFDHKWEANFSWSFFRQLKKVEYVDNDESIGVLYASKMIFSPRWIIAMSKGFHMKLSSLFFNLWFYLGIGQYQKRVIQIKMSVLHRSQV